MVLKVTDILMKALDNHDHKSVQLSAEAVDFATPEMVEQITEVLNSLGADNVDKKISTLMLVVTFTLIEEQKCIKCVKETLNEMFFGKVTLPEDFFDFKVIDDQLDDEADEEDDEDEYYDEDEGGSSVN